VDIRDGRDAHRPAELQTVYQKLRNQGLVSIGVDLRNQECKGSDSNADMHAFTSQYGVIYPIALALASNVALAFQIHPIPTSFFHRSNWHDQLHCGE
jgi:hypothetical protein